MSDKKDHLKDILGERFEAFMTSLAEKQKGLRAAGVEEKEAKDQPEAEEGADDEGFAAFVKAISDSVVSQVKEDFVGHLDKKSCLGVNTKMPVLIHLLV